MKKWALNSIDLKIWLLGDIHGTRDYKRSTAVCLNTPCFRLFVVKFTKIMKQWINCSCWSNNKRLSLRYYTPTQEKCHQEKRVANFPGKLEVARCYIKQAGKSDLCVSKNDIRLVGIMHHCSRYILRSSTFVTKMKLTAAVGLTPDENISRKKGHATLSILSVIRNPDYLMAVFIYVELCVSR